MTPPVLTTGIEEVRKHSTWFLVMGIALVIIGMIAIGSAVVMTIVSVMFLGWLLIIGGVFEVIHGFTRRPWSGFFINLLAGALYAVAGIVMVANPALAAVTLTLLIAMMLIVAGASAEIRIKAVAFLEKLNSASDFDRSWQNWWSKESNVAKLAQEVDLSPTYDLLYRPLCWFVHSSPFANAYYLREKGGNIFSIVGRIDRHLRIEGSPKCCSPRPLLASWTFWPPPTPSLLSAASQNLTELASSSRITTKN